MKKKSTVRHTARKRKNITSSSEFTIFITGFFAVVLLFAASFILNHKSKPVVLGASVYLADQGDTPDSQNHDGPPSSVGVKGDQGGPVINSNKDSQAQVLVDCVGPDGKHSTVTFQECSVLNGQWHKDSFSFTPLGDRKNGSNDSSSVANEASNSGQVESIPSEQSGNNDALRGQIEIKQAGAHLDISEKNPNGSETQISSQNAFEDINSLLAPRDISVSSSSAEGVFIKNNDVEASTKLPNSVDPTTRQITVTTPSVFHILTVLPQQAVQGILNSKVLSQVQSTAKVGGNASQSLQSATLTTLNNVPGFQVNGVSQKNLFGVLPVAFAKTVYVSSQTGAIVKIDESTLNKLLELFSF